jgi:hypothetical protein
MSEFKEYPIYKKRDGKSFEKVSYIFADSFEKAKKEFAIKMTNDNHNLSNNIQWLDKDADKVPETGWYDLDASWFGFTHPDNGDETEGEPDYANATHLELLCSEEVIKKGFDTWSEDVYTWELRED